MEQNPMPSYEPDAPPTTRTRFKGSGARHLSRKARLQNENSTGVARNRRQAPAPCPRISSQAVPYENATGAARNQHRRHQHPVLTSAHKRCKTPARQILQNCDAAVLRPERVRITSLRPAPPSAHDPYQAPVPQNLLPGDQNSFRYWKPSLLLLFPHPLSKSHYRWMNPCPNL